MSVEFLQSQRLEQSQTTYPQTSSATETNPRETTALGFCKIEKTSSQSNEITWLLPTTFLSTLPINNQGDQDRLNPILERFKDEHDVERQITIKACREKSNVDMGIGKDEGRYCDHEFPAENLQITVYYFNHEQCWYVVGLKIYNRDPNHTLIDSIDLVECRSAIPTSNYAECGSGATSPTIGLWKQFETEYEYTIQLVISGSLYQLIVSGLGLIHFEKVSSLEQANQ